MPDSVYEGVWFIWFYRISLIHSLNMKFYHRLSHSIIDNALWKAIINL